MTTRIAISAPNRLADAFGRTLDHLFGADHNPWHQLGALGFFLFWIITATGLYVYALFETSATGAWASVERLSRDPWYIGGLMRSLHRYASDAFVAVMWLHLLRELLHSHWRSFRWFSWLSGVPLIWLAYASGIGGYWLVWDQLAQFSIVATAEWMDWLPLGSQAIVRNFIHPIDDRFFSLLIFLHIGIPLVLLACMWVHIQRISRVRTAPTRHLGLAVMATLLIASVVAPALSHPPADPVSVPSALSLDWPLMFVHPVQYWTSPAALWGMAGGVTLVLAVMPLFGRSPARAPAHVDPRYCNGCARCVDDCPYEAIEMQPRRDGRPGQRMPVVDPDACAACGICAGACPSSTPFRSTEALVSGIDMPDLTIARLRVQLEAGLNRPNGGNPVVVFGCERAARLDALPGSDMVRVPLYCAAMLPPSFVEYGLRSGASIVVINSCRSGECEFRIGRQWLHERLDGTREPHLRSNVDRSLVRTTSFGRGEELAFARAATAILDEAPTASRPSAKPRRRDANA